MVFFSLFGFILFVTIVTLPAQVLYSILIVHCSLFRPIVIFFFLSLSYFVNAYTFCGTPKNGNNFLKFLIELSYRILKARVRSQVSEIELNQLKYLIENHSMRCLIYVDKKERNIHY